MENVAGKIVPEDLRYFSAFNLSLNAELQFDLIGINLHDFAASLAPSRHRANITRSGTNIDEMDRHFRSHQNYTSEQLELYQKKVFSILNKRASPLATQA